IGEVAELAVTLITDLRERRYLVTCRAAARADEGPPKLDEPERDRVQEDTKHLTPVHATVGGELERSHADEIRVRTTADQLDQDADGLPVETALLELSLSKNEPLLVRGRGGLRERSRSRAA